MVKKKEPIKLDIACGQRKQEGFVGVDIAKCEGVDVVHNLNHYPWPFADNSVSEAHTSHYIEHIPAAYWNPGNAYSPEMKSAKSMDALCKFFDEVYRILVPGAQLKIVAPYYNHQRCWQDPTHRRAISDSTFWYVSREWRKANGLDHYGMTCNFEAVWGYGLDQSMMNRNDEYKHFAFKHYTNAIADIHATLTKKE